MGTASTDGVRRVIAAFERSDWTEIDVRSGDVHVRLSTRGAAEPIDDRAAPPGTGSSGDAVSSGSDPATPTRPTSHDERAASSTDGPSATAASPVGRDGAASTDVRMPPGARAVVAPSPGIFWRAPAPGSPPFVDVGDHIDASTTVCIIEVMKLMSHLKADVEGEVVAVFGVDGMPVRSGEPLFAIRPTTPGSGSDIGSGRPPEAGSGTGAGTVT